MVKVFLHLGCLVAFLVAVSIARPVHPRVYPPQRYELILPAGDRSLHGGTAAPPAEQALADDGAVRSERSTNLSHITGTARKIQMYIKNRYLQILPDGAVNGTSDDGSDYTILQRHSVRMGQLLIQSVPTCMFLCMDSCGLLYGSRNFTGDCVFNETFVHSYITYSSSKYSNERRTLYIALNKRGQSRKVQVQKQAPLGKLFSYAMVVIKHVEDDRVKDLAQRILRVRESLQNGSRLVSGDLSMAQHPLRHHGYHHLCPQVQPGSLQFNLEQDDATDDMGRDKLRCRRRKKRKKKKRRCKEAEEEGEQCQKRGVNRKKKCQQGEGEEQCQKRLEAATRKRKSRNGDRKLRDDSEKNKKKQKSVKNKKFISDGEIGKDLGRARTRTDGVGEYIMTTQSESPASSSLPAASTTVPTASATTSSASTIIAAASPSSTILTGSPTAQLSVSTSLSVSTADVATRSEDTSSMPSSGTSTTLGTAK